jgi:RNA polymerase primary sigma factor
MRQLKISNKITKRESISLDKYLNDISKIDLLSPEDEAELARRIHDGDTLALEKLTRANLRFVVSVAKQYQNQGLSLNDLINEGNVGLLKAAKRFDETKGFKFISYAVWWIRQSILQAIVEYSRIVRLPVNKVSIYNRVHQSYLSFIQEFEREPSNEELAELLDIDPSVVGEALISAKKYVEFDAPVSNEESEATLLDLFISDDEDRPDKKIMEESLKNEVLIGLSVLSPREVEVLKAYYGLGDGQALNLEEIGELYGLTRERVRQIKERALRRLRRSVNKNVFETLLT